MERKNRVGLTKEEFEKVNPLIIGTPEEKLAIRQSGAKATHKTRAQKKQTRELAAYLWAGKVTAKQLEKIKEIQPNINEADISLETYAIVNAITINTMKGDVTALIRLLELAGKITPVEVQAAKASQPTSVEVVFTKE